MPGFASPLRLSWAEFTILPQILTAIKLIASPWVTGAGLLMAQLRLPQGRGIWVPLLFVGYEPLACRIKPF